MRSIDFFELFYERQYGNCLDCFTETHVISQYTTYTTFVKTYHPVESHELVILQHAAFKNWGLFCQSSEDILLEFLFLDHLLDFLVLFFKVAPFFGFYLCVLSENLMFWQ
jgi:hypothetical protein